MTNLTASIFLTAVLAGQIAAKAETYEQAVQKALRHLGQPIPQILKLDRAESLDAKFLPAKIAVQKVVPRKFDDEIIDRLLKFTELDRRQTFKGANRGIFGTPGVKYFGVLEKDHTLAIIPARGLVSYVRTEATDDKGDTAAVAQAKELLLPRALEIGKMLGLHESDFARHPLTGKFDVTYSKIERSTFNTDLRVVQRSIFLRRSIAGLPVVTGHLYGGLWVGLGINGMVHEIKLTARATEPLSMIEAAPLDEQIIALRNSKQVFTVQWPEEFRTAKSLQEATLVLELVEAVYFEAAPEDVQKIIPPLLRWEGELKSNNQKYPVILFTPIKVAKPKHD